VALVLLWNRKQLRTSHAAPAPAHAVTSGDPALRGWRLLRSPVILRNLCFFFLTAVASGGIWSYTIVALGALYQTPLRIASTALTLYLLMAAFGVLLGGVIADRTRQHTRVAAIGLAISAAAILVIALVDLHAWLLMLMMVVGGLLNGVVQPSRDMIVRSATPPGSFGKVFGFVSAGFNVGGVVSPLLYGWMMDHGAPRAVFLTVVVMTLVSLLTVLTPAKRIARVVPAE